MACAPVAVFNLPYPQSRTNMVPCGYRYHCINNTKRFCFRYLCLNTPSVSYSWIHTVQHYISPRGLQHRRRYIIHRKATRDGNGQGQEPVLRLYRLYPVYRRTGRALSRNGRCWLRAEWRRQTSSAGGGEWSNARALRASLTFASRPAGPAAASRL